MNLRLFYVLFILFAFFSCIEEYQTEEEMEEQYNSIPNISFKKITQVNVKHGRKQFVAMADNAEIYNNSKSNKMILKKLKFEQFDKKVEVVTSGRADKASLNFKNSDIKIEGNVDIYSKKEKAQLKTNYLLWEDKSKIIKGNMDDEINIKKDDGTEISGKGFKVETKKNIITFQKDVHGFFVAKKDNKKKNNKKDKK